MKIVHLCLACFYIEGMEYQENVLPRKHRELGYDVEVIASPYCFDTKGNTLYREAGQYVNKDDVRVRVIPYNKRFYGRHAENLRMFSNLYESLNDAKPDIIFSHGGHFGNVGQLIKYLKKNPGVKLYVDSHSDYINGPVDTWKKKMFRKYWCGWLYRRLEPYCEKMWATLPVRLEYLRDIFGVKSDKVDLLVMGGDVRKLDAQEKSQIRARVRGRYGIAESTFLITSGGKIDREKNIHLLMEAVSDLKGKDIKLVVFGEPTKEFQPVISSLMQSDNIKMAGWLRPDECYELFYASDLAVFPGTHSVLWEQVCACELPALFRGTEGQNHIDMGGNCQFLYKDDVSEIRSKILEIAENQQLYSSMKNVSVEKGYKAFSYMEIAKRAIGIS
jgi:1,2-diacylglycerol 3-alpha-glucosyltransferase